MAAVALAQQFMLLAEQAHALLNQFEADQQQRPEYAWEPLVELRQLLDQLQLAHPPKAFRRRHS